MKLVAVSSEFDFTLSRVHRAHFFQLQIRKKKRDILSEKRESGMALKKREFTPESGSVDTYEFVVRNGISRIVKMLKLVCALAIGEAPIHDVATRGKQRSVATDWYFSHSPSC